MCRLTLLPANQVITARAGDTILDACLDAGVALPHECGGNCACTTCHVIIEAGSENLSPMEEVEIDRLSTGDGVTPRSRLGCQALLQGGSVTLTIPDPEPDW